MISPGFQIQSAADVISGQGMKKSGSETVSLGRKGSQFLNIFQNAIKKGETAGDLGIAFGEAMNGDKVNQMSAVEMLANIGDTENTENSGIINQLKEHLLSKYGSLDDLTVDDETIDSLKQYLLDAGFNEGSVTKVLESFRNNDSEEGMTLFELFDVLDKIELQSNENENADTPMLEIAMVPYIESVLASIGLPPDIVSSLMSDVKEDGRGINLSKLISNLQDIEKESFLTGKPLQSLPGDKQIQEILEGMGITGLGGEDKPLTLGEFVRVLETYRNNAKSDLPMDSLKSGVVVDNLKSSVVVDSLKSGVMVDNLNADLSIDGTKTGPALDFENDDLKNFLNKIQTAVQSETNINGKVEAGADDEVSKLMGNEAVLQFTDKKTDQISELPKFAKGKKSDKVLGVNIDPLVSGVTDNTGMPQEVDTVLQVPGNGLNLTGENDVNLQKDKIIEVFEKAATLETPMQERASEGFANVRDFKNEMEARVSERKNDDISVVNEFTKSVNGKERAIDGTVLKPASRNLPVYVVNQVGHQLARALNMGDSTLQFNLKPNHMGRLQMSIDNSSDGLKVTIIAEHQTTKDMLMNQSSELRATLAEQGIKVSSIDIEFSSNYDQAMADSKQDKNDSDNNKKGFMNGKNRLIKNQPTETVIRKGGIADGSNLDLVA